MTDLLIIYLNANKPIYYAKLIRLLSRYQDFHGKCNSSAPINTDSIDRHILMRVLKTQEFIYYICGRNQCDCELKNNFSSHDSTGFFRSPLFVIFTLQTRVQFSHWTIFFCPIYNSNWLLSSYEEMFCLQCFTISIVHVVINNISYMDSLPVQ